MLCGPSLGHQSDVNRELRSEIVALGGDPTQPAWHWFLINGPHGSSFTWGQTRGEPAGYVGLEHLRRIVAEHQASNPEFLAEVTAVLAKALMSSKPEFLRRAIQVAGALELVALRERIRSLLSHPDTQIAGDARACIFALRTSVEEAGA